MFGRPGFLRFVWGLAGPSWRRVGSILPFVGVPIGFWNILGRPGCRCVPPPSVFFRLGSTW
eukprot:3927421-Pyramimonas_sp.AAC.1